jgi:SLOG family YspA-like protein
MKTAIVTGSRDWTDNKAVYDALEASGCDHVVQGGCPTGADMWARDWAKYKDLPCLTVCANWNKHGKAAGPIRNRHMMELYGKGDPDAVVLAFRKNNSRGTTSAINIAEEFGIKTYIVEQE